MDSGNIYPDVKEEEWYHVVITKQKQDSPKDPEIYINNKKYYARNETTIYIYFKP